MKRKFIINKSFSINSADDFRDYAHNIMKQAHGDEYSEETTNKVVDDLLNDNPNADYGELIGRLTSGFSQKSFAGGSELIKSYKAYIKEQEDKLNDLKEKMKTDNSEVLKLKAEKAQIIIEQANTYIAMEEIKMKYNEQMVQLDQKIGVSNLKLEKINARIKSLK